ncbi:disintegrin and metalloproteinase domain-containing protein 9-like [Lepidochelys kempii]|uniref:disintegrin and metalloproteinase domain-containing protein 9-like n=1 Tax=Lepidochelys kempii TaxID=8472 RepID=UPI003C704D2E
MGLQVWALLLLLSPGFSETSNFSYSEIIVPKKLEPRDGIDNKEEVSYLIRVEGKHHIVHLLQKKMFIAPNFPVFTYNQKGDLITDYPYIRDDCYYSGYVEDVPESVAVLSTCSGLWGHLKVYDLNYEIEPVKSSSTFQHIIYRMMAEEDSPGRCGVIDEDIKDGAAENREHQIPEIQTEKQLVIGKDGLSPSYTSSRYLECYFVADKAKFRLEDSNETLVTLKMLQYIHLTSEMYRPFGLHIILVGLEIWTERDLITITHLLDQVIGFFLSYVENFLQHRVHFDHTELIVRDLAQCSMMQSVLHMRWAILLASFMIILREIQLEAVFANALEEENASCGHLPQAHLAPLSCFKTVNTKGDRCGNCGGDGLAYKKCQHKDVLCGRLQCVNVKKISQSNYRGSIVQTPVGNVLCWGTEFSAGMEVVDIGSVRDGTACGDNKICINRTCVNITVLNYDCHDKKCSGRGVCNSNRNCHCDFGWAPPDCKYKGFGGSVDSGPPPTPNVSDNIILGTVIGGTLFLLLITSLAFFKKAQISQFLGR